MRFPPAAYCGPRPGPASRRRRARMRHVLSVLLLAPMEPASPSGLDSSALHPMAPRAGNRITGHVCGMPPAPVVWIGEANLFSIRRWDSWTRCIAGTGRDVFSGDRRRSFFGGAFTNFRPVSRLFLTIQWNGLERSHDVRAGTRGRVPGSARRNAWLRGLSGFLICVHALFSRRRLHWERWPSQSTLARSLDVDGNCDFERERGDRTPRIRKRRTCSRKSWKARKLIGSKWWESFFAALWGPW